MKVSVISATFNRAELLDNALYTYSKQTLPASDWEYLLCDDGSADHTQEVVQAWQKKGLPIRYFSASGDLGLPKEPGAWRDGCKLRNALSTHAHGEVLVATHPEIMVPPDALEVMHREIQARPKAWVTAIPYWLPDAKLPPWKKDLHRLRETPGFYDPSWPTPLHSPGAPDYRNQNQEIRATWESEVFWAMDMRQWRWMGGFREFAVWGSVDMDFLSRRQALGIPTVLAKSELSPHTNHTLMVYHQYHESKRDMDAALKALEGASYPSAEAARRAGGLYGLYHSGIRERARDGKLEGILADHQARYRFANTFADDKTVLDVCCGTGYGALLMPNANAYIGIDLDAESIAWARDHYGQRDRIAFATGSATDLKLSGYDWEDLTEKISLLLCFEGIEHVPYADQPKLVDEMYRVLRPGGTFILSTPIKGQTPGTPWDQFMLTPLELLELFSDERWVRLDWFVQNYGSPEPPRPVDFGDFAGAQVMVLGGTVVK